MSTDMLKSRERWPKAVTIVLVLAIALVIALLVILFSAFPKEPENREPPIVELDLTEACRENQWVGVLKENFPAGCPEHWDPLFAAAIPPPEEGEDRPAYTREAAQELIPPGLRRFCVSQSIPEGQRPSVADPEVESGWLTYDEFERIDQDCSVVGGAAGSFFPIDDFDQALTARFRREAGRSAPIEPPGDSDQAGVRAVPPPRGVRLVIVDSAQDSEDPQDQECPIDPGPGKPECSPHGWALTKLARDLLCHGQDCAAQISTRRALRWTYEIQKKGSKPKKVELDVTDPDGEATGGGRFGAWEDIALAIRREVAEWSAIGVDDRPNLILNLSLGWESAYGEPPVVRAAIEDAVCRGALVLAAAGNRIAGPPFMDTPVLPAACEAEPSPSRERC